MALPASLVYQYTCGSLTHIITIKELDFNNIGNHISLDGLDFQFFFKSISFRKISWINWNTICLKKEEGSLGSGGLGNST